ncbi:MAG: VacJ family lipoprotein [Pseudohongiellaceae bacterium]
MKHLLLICCLLLPASAWSADPWQSFNQRIYRFNDFLDTLVFRPVAVTYSTLTPRVVRQGIGNFFSNIDDINVTVNDLLQLKLDAALSDSGRVLVNSTIGVVGIFDVATSMGLEKNEEDFGQTLGRWNVGAGNYVVLPFFGPSTVRDTLGLVVDTLFNPIQYYDDNSTRVVLFSVREIDSRASVLSLEELMTGDRYLFMREAYLQRREYLVADGEIEDDFGGF